MPKNIFYLPIMNLLLLGLLLGCTHLPSLHSVSSGQNTPIAPPPTRAELSDDAFWTGNATVTWNRLQQLPLKQLESLSPADPTRQGWVTLAILSKRFSKDTRQLINEMERWQKTYPTHPANTFLPSKSVLQSILETPAPTRIALLLPLQGTKGGSGQSVRDGFLSAYYASLGKTHTQQTISFYDTTTQDVNVLYQKALNDGAELVIGPLMKEEVESLIQHHSFPVTTLALNYTDNRLPPNLYEFGLSPLDESQQIADKAWRDRRGRAILIAPDNTWGKRVSQHLMARFESIGGHISDTFYYSNQTDFNSAIASLLQVDPLADQGRGKKETNKTLLNKRRRQDFDVIFLLAQPQEGREIVPLLRYYYAENIPIYSTSVIYAGVPNPQKDTDLNGILFVDTPSLLFGGTHNRLRSVGSDAYFLSHELTRLTRLPAFPLYGETGALTLDSNRQIHRRLPWTTFQHGSPS